MTDTDALVVYPAYPASVPALIGRAGKPAARRFLEFFTVNIRNKNTRAAYGRAALAFFAWCEERGLAELSQVQPVHVAAYVEQLGRQRSAPTVKQHLACLRMLFDWLEAYLDSYIAVAGIEGDRKGPLFRAAVGRTATLSDRAMGRTDVWYMIQRRAADAELETAIGCHTFRATGITDYLTNGGKLEIAQRMAGHSNAKTTGLYDRRNDDISVSEVERVGI